MKPARRAARVPFPPANSSSTRLSNRRSPAGRKPRSCSTRRAQKAAASAIGHFREWQDRWRARNSHPLFHEEGKQLNLVLSGLSSTLPNEFAQLGTPLLAVISWIVWCYPGESERAFREAFREFWERKIAEDSGLAGFEVRIELHRG